MTDCVELWVCIGTEGHWVMGQTYGSGLFFGTTIDLTKSPQDQQASTIFCDGAWTEGAGGQGSLTFSCAGELTVSLSLQMEASGTERRFGGSGQADDGRFARVWSGQAIASDIYARMSEHHQEWRRVYGSPYTCEPEAQVS